MAVPFNLPRADEEDYQLIHELLMTVQRAVYQIIFRRSHGIPHQQPPNPGPRILRGSCPRCGRGGGEDNGAIPAPVPGGGPPAPDEPNPGARNLPDVVPHGDAAPAGEPTPPARRGRPQPPARRARRRRPPPPVPPPVPPPRGVRQASTSGQKKYWELAGENLRHIADEFHPSAP